VANPTGSNSDLPAANYKGSNQGNTGGGYQTATTRSYIPTNDGFTSSPGGFISSPGGLGPSTSGFASSPGVFTPSTGGFRPTDSRWNPFPASFGSYSTVTSGEYERQPGVTQIPTFSNNDPLTASFGGLTFSPPTVTQAVQSGGVAVAKVTKSTPNSGTFEELDPSE
jgi:hypothetical protein